MTRRLGLHDLGQLVAHGIGGAQDLPIPVHLAVAGAVVALAVSFTVLAVAWRQPRFDRREGRPAPDRLAAAVDSTAFTVVARTFGFAVFAWAVMAAVFGKDVLINPFFGMFYVLQWVAVVPLSLLLGPFYRAVSPIRTLHAGLAKVAGIDPAEGMLRYPERLGQWPAAFGLFAFVWLELVYPHNADLGPVRLWYAVYVAAVFVGGAVFGERFFAMADPFEVYSTLVGRLSFFGRDERPGEQVDEQVDGRGRLLLRSPLTNLAHTPAYPGLVGVVAVMFGSTAFDSFKDSQPWYGIVRHVDASSFLLDNVALVVFCVTVGVLFTVATAATGVGPELDRRRLPRLFAHSMAPIIVGYVFAHYLTFLVEEGQQTLIWMSDPFSTGANYLGTGDRAVDTWLSSHPGFLASVKVLSVVVGHVVAVVAAHDRAVTLLPRRHQLTGQLPLLIVMVAFTIGGIYLLFAA